MRRATANRVALTCSLVFQSTLSVRRATNGAIKTIGNIVISIHALREESDPLGSFWPGEIMISIHALREESDFHVGVPELDVMLFQSTLSVRRATLQAQAGLQTHGISIHALREESD